MLFVWKLQKHVGMKYALNHLYQMSNLLAARDISQEFLFICDVIKRSNFIYTCILWLYVLHKGW
jgi:hypothetical protein